MTRSGVSTLERNQPFMRSFQEHAKTSLLIDPEATIQWYHSRFLRKSLLPISVGLIIAEYYWRNTVVDNSGSFKPPELNPPSDAWAFPLASKNYVHVIPTTGWKSKNWAPEKWARTINKLTKYGIGPTMMTSGKQQWQRKHFDLR